MVSPPFTVGLRLTLEAAYGEAEGPVPTSSRPWRDQLSSVALREPTSCRLPDNVVPSDDCAEQLLNASFAKHPMVNTSRRLEPGGATDALPRVAGRAFVIAQIALLPDMAPVPPGGEPDLTDDEVGHPLLVHASLWRHDPGTEAERVAAEELLERIAAELPRDLWRRDG